ncbi:ATP phosphoribosyltransferase regulatory subunit [Eubacterium ruminantium]|nr:ATP phosphoribosyltransferase regulatory subunit [Eubacterium ruminantium]
MNEKLLHTPEGVRDIYGTECLERQEVISRIKKVLKSYAYSEIETPSFEYFDIFNMDKGSAPSNEMYKFFDRNNNTLVLRPDITPSIARSAAKYFADEELPIRLSYMGRTFKNEPLHQGKLHETTQIGCELINDDSSAADAEILACIVDVVRVSGLKNFQIEIGEVEFFKGIIEEAGLGSEEEESIKEFIQMRNFFGLIEYVKRLDISDNSKEALCSFDKFFGGVEMLDRAEKITKSEKALTAIGRLRKVYNVLSFYGYENYIGFDLGMLNGYGYYTGIVFRAYTYGTGSAIVRGGRYNNLLAKFGKDAPSIGFAIMIDDLMMAVTRQHINIDVDTNRALVIYEIENQQSAVLLAEKLRERNVEASLIRKSSRHSLSEYEEYARKYEFDKIYIVKDNEEVDEHYILSEEIMQLKDKYKNEAEAGGVL